MSIRTLFALILSVSFGGSAAFGVKSYMNKDGSAVGGDFVKVVIVTVDVPRGMVLRAEHVRVQDVPKGQVHAHALTKVEDVINRAALTPLMKDEVVLNPKLAPKGSRGSMSWVTKSGMRAFTIQTNLSAGIAGLAMPGDHVDVLLTMQGEHSDSASGGGSTSTLLQNIEVMAIDQAVEAPAANKVDLRELRSVTLQVTPDQAMVLDLGQAKGLLHLSLRNPEDSREASTRPATLNDLKLRQVRPWDDRVKGVIGALGQMMAARAAEKAAAEKAAAERAAADKAAAEKLAAEKILRPAPAPVVYIRTIRGTQEGAVSIEKSGRPASAF